MGISSVEDLFSDIPEGVTVKGVDLPPGKTEMEVERIIKDISAKNTPLNEVNSFLGAGVYNHFTPAVVDYLSSRSEFLTTYTPYQGEISQGMLQCLFEYQSYIAELTGLDMSNSSLYDAATAIGEAAIMCKAVTRKREFIVASPLPKSKISVLANYTRYQNIVIKTVDHDPVTGGLSLESLASSITGDTCGIYVENPNFFGVLEKDIAKIPEMLGDGRKRPLFVEGFNLLTAPFVQNPGETGADVAIGEVQFGNPPSFGGPGAGYIACNKKFVRKMPGRLIGYTKDRDGEDSYVMTLQTREQHIRRERATSNICSNQALCAVRCAMTLACLGSRGLYEMSLANLTNAHRLQNELSKIHGISSPQFKGDFFNEFVVTIDPEIINPVILYDDLLKMGNIFGYPLGADFPEHENSFLLCATELNSNESIDKLITDLKSMGVV